MKYTKHELRVCTLDKENNTVFIGRRQLVLSIKQVPFSYTEQEDAGGGWYWKGKGVRKTGIRTEYHVYDLSSNYIGEVVYSGHFINPKTFHLKVHINNLHLLAKENAPLIPPPPMTSNTDTR